MTGFRRLLAVFFGLFLASPLFSQSSGGRPETDPSGEWVIITVVFGENLGERLQLKVEKDQLSGTLFRDEGAALKGTVKGQELKFSFKESGGDQSEYTGHVSGEVLLGEYTTIDSHGEKTTGMWSARRIPVRPSGGPRRLEFVPRVFQRAFSSKTEPVLHIWPGDTVHTTSVDAGGTDEKGVTRVLGGNPLTGPFYVETAMPGDVLAITFKKLKLNRDWAISDKAFVNRAMTNEYAAKNKQDWSDTRWHLDLEKGIATLEKPSDAMKDFGVPVRPMLGCVGVAPGFGSAPISSQDSGGYGGNMDFNQIAEGTTLYLGVSQPGALLYVGDGHALQGDGELNGNALETSMDIEFSVEVRQKKEIGTPRAENSDFLMAMGLAGSLDNAFSRATSELATWLQEDYKLSSSDVAAILGSSIQYSVSEVADRNVGVIAKISKKALGAVKVAATK
jgi:acetamidase/formamidase